MDEKPVAAGKSSYDLIDPAAFFAAVDIRPGARVLDMAAGAGRYSLEIAKLVGDSGMVHAVDAWEEGIESLRAAVRRQGLANVDPILADITGRIQLDDASIDLCLMATILHDLAPEGQDAALREAARLLKPGGVLAVVEFKKIDRGPGPPARVRISEPEAEQMLGRHGFRKTHGAELGEFTYLLVFRKAVQTAVVSAVE